jgi:hypothetical protein
MDRIYSQDDWQIIKIIKRYVGSQPVENSYYDVVTQVHTTLTAEQFTYKYGSSSKDHGRAHIAAVQSAHTKNVDRITHSEIDRCIHSVIQLSSLSQHNLKNIKI